MKQLQLLAFKDVVSVLEKENVVYTYWPEEWINLLRKPAKQWELKRKLEGLTERLFVIFSDILFIQNDAQALMGNRPWIVTKRPLHQEQFEYVCKAWLKVLDENNEIPMLVDNEMKWHNGSVKDVFEGDNHAHFKWVPAIVTDKICEEPLRLSVSPEIASDVTFYRIQSGRVFEAISEPIRKNNRQDYFSYVYRFEAITRGVENKPLLKVSFGIRRYYQKGTKLVNLIRNRQNVTVYVSIPNPFINEEKRTFAKLKIEQGKSGVKWAQNSFKLLDDLILGELPELNEVMKDPKSYIEGVDKQILCVYNESTFSIVGTKVQRGIGLPEKEELLNVFMDRFPNFEITSPGKEVKTSFNDHVLPLYAPSGIEELKLEICSHHMAEKVKEVLVKKELAVKTEDGNCFVLKTEPEVTLKIVVKSPEGIVQDLDYDQYREKAVARHIQTLVRNIDRCEQNTLSLIEIEAYENKKVDPKHAIREGLARTGRITQFIYPIEYDAAGEERIFKAILDLLADKGFRKRNWNKFHYKGIILSLSLMRIKRGRGTEFLPVLTKIQEGKLEYKLYSDNEWRSLDGSILNVYNHKHFLQYKENEKLKPFIVNELLHILNRTEEQVCFIAEANLRYGWIPELANPKMKLEEITQFDDMLATFPNLRVIRINQTSDVPQYFIHEKDSYINKKSGLYRDETGIYYSVGLRPSTMKGVANTAKKIDAPTKMIFQQRAVEIIVSGAEENERDELACMVDYLRRMVVTFEKHTQLPLPMHMVRSIKKYIAQDDVYIQQDDWEDDIILEEDGQLAVVF
ncbi:hypothetical protein CON32_22905 [Bacillus cereus]|nr:hypothetical protein CON32_22905 [Bacillus cereus]